MSAILDGAVTTLAFCWRLERRDGAALGFTSHDRDLEAGNFRYRAAPGMAPSAIELFDGFAAETLSVGGALSGAGLSEADLMAGRWDGAAVHLFLLDWERPDAEPVPLARGVLGDVRLSGVGFETELLGPAAMLERPVVEETSPGCRARLGDRRCRVDLAGRVRIVAVAAADDAMLEVDGAEPGVGLYTYGRLRWLTGANSGLESMVRSSDGGRLRLREPPLHAVAAGDLAEIAQGCDKSFPTCTGRFNNAVNFRGEPHLPGMDLLTRYPGAS
ncbi:MAG TPA: DUF2163 domain-containing protein [Allosphingosinicella sp.]|nr:DUF2163 domain-containing protein [Allosphingosinicella sp.]